MNEKSRRLSPAAREALMVWLKFLLLLGGLFVVGWTVFNVRRWLG